MSNLAVRSSAIGGSAATFIVGAALAAQRHLGISLGPGLPGGAVQTCQFSPECPTCPDCVCPQCSENKEVEDTSKTNVCVSLSPDAVNWLAVILSNVGTLATAVGVGRRLGGRRGRPRRHDRHLQNLAAPALDGGVHGGAEERLPLRRGSSFR